MKQPVVNPTQINADGVPYADKEKDVAIGRIVHFVMSEGAKTGECRPSIIVKVVTVKELDGKKHWEVNANVFTDSHSDGYSSGMICKQSVLYSEDRLNGTWHWAKDDKQ